MSDRVNFRYNNSPTFRLLSDDQKEEIFMGVVRTLHDTGANVHHEGARERHGGSSRLLRSQGRATPPVLEPREPRQSRGLFGRGRRGVTPGQHR